MGKAEGIYSAAISLFPVQNPVDRDRAEQGLQCTSFAPTTAINICIVQRRIQTYEQRQNKVLL